MLSASSQPPEDQTSTLGQNNQIFSSPEASGVDLSNGTLPQARWGGKLSHDEYHHQLFEFNNSLDSLAPEEIKRREVEFQRKDYDLFIEHAVGKEFPQELRDRSMPHAKSS